MVDFHTELRERLDGERAAEVARGDGAARRGPRDERARGAAPRNRVLEDRGEDARVAADAELVERARRGAREEAQLVHAALDERRHDEACEGA